MSQQNQIIGTPTIRFQSATFNEHERNANIPDTDGIYYGSYRRRSRHRSQPGTPSGVSTPVTSAPTSPRGSLSQQRLEELLQNADVYQETYDLEELRDGFFDGFFFARGRSEVEELSEQLEPPENEGASVGDIILGQYHAFTRVLHDVAHTRAGIKLLKSFIAVYIAFLICLIGPASQRLGRYSYIMVISTIVNHPGRTIGAQIDGLLLTTIGGAAGMAWGSLALYTSTSTTAARSGYGGVLAAFLVPFTAMCAYLRCTLARFYQATLCGGIGICYICLADASSEVGWYKIFAFAVPWLLGQAVALATCLTVFPDAGSRPFAVALHTALDTLSQALELPRPDDREIRQKLAFHITNLSDAVRDLTIDLSVTRYNPEDARALRNIIQGVIRAVLVLKPETHLFSLAESSTEGPNDKYDQADSQSVAILISQRLSAPTRTLTKALLEALLVCDACLMDLSGYRRYLGPSAHVSTDTTGTLLAINAATEVFDKADEELLRDPRLPRAYSDHPEVVQLLLYVHPIRLVAEKMKALLEKVGEMNGRRLRVYFPSYPMHKALNRNNAQVRHDRGGLTAAFYFRTKNQLERAMNDLQSRPYVPMPRRPSERQAANFDLGRGIIRRRERVHQTPAARLWAILHHLQGFETKFALKVVIATTTLSVPAWLPQSRQWWNDHDVWWAVVMVWLMMHPRVGGNFQDLLTRVITTLLGSIWAGCANTSYNGNPYVVAVFALAFMIPMLFRFTQSKHPRSGLAGCLAFTVTSLSARRQVHVPDGYFEDAVIKASGFVVGVVAAIIINWIIWPFVARHELRKSLSTMFMHLSILYRGVIGRYIYYLETEPPTSADVGRSEMLEGRLREAFIRIRQLLDLTRHEIRLRAPFNPRPYERLIESCEEFFEDLVQIRQSSLYFQPKMHQVSGLEGQVMNQILLSYRRDAVAAVLMDLYVLAGAMKTNRPVPRYTPSAVMARKRLLDKTAELESEDNQADRLGLQRTMTQGRRWANVYQYAFNVSLTDIVEQLETIQLLAKVVLGERGFNVVTEKISL